MNPRHVVIVNGLWAGHHPMYTKTFARILLEEGCRVTVFCPAPQEIEASIAQYSLPGVHSLKAHHYTDRNLSLWAIIPGRLRHAVTCLVRWHHLSNALKKNVPDSDKPDMVFFAWLDNYLSTYIPAWWVDWRFPFKWSGLYFHPRHLREMNAKGLLKNKFFKAPENLIANSRYACGLAILDEGVLANLRANLLHRRAYLFPDFIDDIPPADNYQPVEEIKHRAKGRKIISLLGSLAKRKGLLTLLDIASQSSDRDWYFVFAGELVEKTFSKEELARIRQLSTEQEDNCFFYFDRIPDDAQFNALLKVSDVIFAAYENFPHSSNLITKAAANQKPILVSAGGYMEEVVRRYRLGGVVSESRIEEYMTGLEKLTEWGAEEDSLLGMHEYFTKQSQGVLRQELLSLVEDCSNKIINDTEL